MKKHLLSFTLALACAATLAPQGTSCAQGLEESSAVLIEAAETPGPAGTVSRVQLPNPMVPYASYHAMQEALGFRPLVLPRAEGYEHTEAYVIGGTVGDLRYQSRYGAPAQRSRVTIRTALRDDIEESDPVVAATTLSGVYSVTWEPLTLNGKTVLLAKVSDTSFAACWSEGAYLFSCTGENFNRWDFAYRLVPDLLDVTAHYYSED